MSDVVLPKGYVEYDVLKYERWIHQKRAEFEATPFCYDIDKLCQTLQKNIIIDGITVWGNPQFGECVTDLRVNICLEWKDDDGDYVAPTIACLYESNYLKKIAEVETRCREYIQRFCELRQLQDELDDFGYRLVTFCDEEE